MLPYIFDPQEYVWGLLFKWLVLMPFPEFGTQLAPQQIRPPLPESIEVQEYQSVVCSRFLGFAPFKKHGRTHRWPCAHVETHFHNRHMAACYSVTNSWLTFSHCKVSVCTYLHASGCPCWRRTPLLQQVHGGLPVTTTYWSMFVSRKVG